MRGIRHPEGRRFARLLFLTEHSLLELSVGRTNLCLAALEIDDGVRRRRVEKPNIAADDGAFPDGDVAQDRRSSVDGHVIFNVGVTLDAFNDPALVVFLETFSAKGHTLINLYVASDDARLTNDDASA